MTTLLYAPKVLRESHALTQRLLIAGFGLCYLAAFWSLWVQVIGLIGENGILPAGEFFAHIEAQAGTERLWRLPTLNWIIGGGNGALHFLCAVGTLASLAMVAGLAPALSALVCWSFYLSLYAAGQQFLSFQWDILLLEAGFPALFLAPPFTVRLTRETPPPSLAVIWLYRLLIFKLMWSSGVVKLSGGDETWSGLTALSYHYETTCLPAWPGWILHQMPMWFHKVSAVFMFGIELVVPLGIFFGRIPRLVAAISFTGLMLFIGATGNYGFFNLLTIVLCVPLLCDAQWPAWLRARLASPAQEPAPPAWPDDVAEEKAPPPVPLPKRPWPRAAIGGLVALELLCNIIPITNAFRPQWNYPGPLRWLHGMQSAFHIASGYGLFASMTTRRPEIVFEASNDGATWEPYELPYKPGEPARRPGLYGLHMPRVDWQLWFAALSGARRHVWTLDLAERLLQGEPTVLALFEKVPVQKPRYVRARLWDYHFTRWGTEDWWTREPLGGFLPVLTLGAGGRLELARMEGAR